jgi:hypothetical protein
MTQPKNQIQQDAVTSYSTDNQRRTLEQLECDVADEGDAAATRYL